MFLSIQRNPSNMMNTTKVKKHAYVYHYMYVCKDAVYLFIINIIIGM